jgi:tRNA (guanine37-N1)-methyltransferase
MRFDVITLFPELFDAPLRTSLLGKAVESGTIAVHVTDLRDFGIGPHKSVDDEPYGGGAGMVLRPEPVFEAVESVREPQSHVILMSARGVRLDQSRVASLAKNQHLILICGRYEGVDERVAQHLADEEISIGDYVLAGGELPALVTIEAVSRLIPSVLGNELSLETESHTSGLLEYPQYTRPAEYRGWRVPEVLVSGDHGRIAEWRREESHRVTRERRPDLLDG